MYPYFRGIKLALQPKPKTPLEPFKESVIHTRVWPGDIDVFMELNNGRYLTIMDFGRFNHAQLTGLSVEAKKNRWGFAVAGSSIRYRKRLTLFNKLVVKTKIVAVDEKWTYFQQVIEHKGQWACAALIRTAVTANRKILPSAEVYQAMGHPTEYFMPEWVKKWDESDQMRPWGEHSDNSPS